jgi:probable rRNA maturation factor
MKKDRPPTRRSAPPKKPGPPLSLEIRIQSRRWRELADLRERIGQAVQAALSVSPVKPLEGAELSLLLTDDKRIRVINRDWRGFDKATNVLSFPAAPPERIAGSPVLGDIVLAFETVLREAEAENKVVADHLSHLVIHGLLHLLGEDHETPAEAEHMEALEIAGLALLGIADPYADSDPVADAATPTPTMSPSTS